MNRLNQAEVAGLPFNIVVPTYDRSRLMPRIVHLGVGNFHRTHQAFYTESALNQAWAQGDESNLDWGICGISLRSATMRDRLAEQDYLYTLEVRESDQRSRQVIGCLIDILVAPENPQAVINALNSCDVITLTVTEKAYCLKADGSLNLQHPDIVHDRQNPEDPTTVYAYLAASLAARQKDKLKPVTIISCDNITDNGHKLQAALTTFLGNHNENLLQWIDENVCFPTTMVDRISPATTSKAIESVSAALGVEDRAPVITEPFTQWLVEDRFCTEIPDWAGAGAQIVSDVTPYENIKLRMLNGSHSTLAYLGSLAGYATVSDGVENPILKAFLDRLMRDEIQPTLNVPVGFDIDAYRHQLLDRFANTATHHLLHQIAMDGSQKLPQRLLPVLNERLAADEDFDCLGLAVAAWIFYVRGFDFAGKPISLNDPLASELRNASDANLSDVAGFVRDSGVFSAYLVGNTQFISMLERCLERMKTGSLKDLFI